MRLTKLWILSAALSAFCGVAAADSFTDPAMGMDAGSFSTALSTFTSFTPDQTNGGGFLDLFNDTGELITSITFETTIKTGLTGINVDTISRTFPCNGATNLTLPNPFFLNCDVTYDSTSGHLDFKFVGVNPPGGGPDEGIPPLPPGCTALNADSDPSCTGQGHFAIIFNDGFATTGDSGGWLGTDTDLFNGPPVFSVAAVTTEQVTPEPASLLLAGAGLLALAVGRRRLLRP